jgi:hypothetical protein
VHARSLAPLQIVLDLALIIEATAEDQLPEQVLACMQWHRPDFSNCEQCPPLPAEPSEARPSTAPSRHV